jgi:hypothetical protein
MECYEGAKMIKTFRGRMTDDSVDTIVLHTNDGSLGYRIVDFQLINKSPGAAGVEGIMKIYKVPQTVASVDGVIDFSDQTLLAAGYYTENAAVTDPVSHRVIFENEVFNQDIYLTYHENVGSEPMNYYLELEQVKLNLDENTVATLKDIRNVKTQGF